MTKQNFFIATYSLFWSLLFCIIISPAFASKGTPSSTFKDFYQTMVKNNSSYVGAILDTNAAIERRAGTNGAYFPTLSASYTLNDTETTSSRAISSSLSGKIPQLGLTYSSSVYNNTLTRIPPPESNSGSYSLELGLSLLKDFGPRVGNIPFEQADYTLDSARIAQTKSTYDLISQLISSYVGAISAQKNLELNEKSAKTNAEDLRRARALYEAGKIPRLSLLTVQTQSQQIQSQIIQGERALREALKQLYSVSSIAEDPTQISIQTHLDPLPTPLFNESIIQNLLNSKLDLEQTKNTDYLSAKIGIQTGKFSVTQAENNLLPSLNLSATHNTSETSSSMTRVLPKNDPGNTVVLSLSMPIGLVTERHELSATRLNYQKTELAFNQLRRQLLRDWSTLVEDYRLLKEQYRIARELAQSAKLKYEASLPTASLGSTYQQNIVTFQNEMSTTQASLNQLDVEVLTLQFKILSFHGHPHALEIFRRML